MGRHSKHQSTREFFTSGEREKAKARHGTISTRLGADSQTKFDECNLCHARLRDPVSTPSGALFCRSCIISNLVAQKEALQLQREAFMAQQAEREAAAAAKARSAASAGVAAFARVETGAPVAVVSVAPEAPLSTLEMQRRIVAAATDVTSKMDMRDKAQVRAEVEKSSFWVPDAAPLAEDATLTTPDAHPRDPVSGAPLRLKELITVHFTPTPAHGPESETADAAGAAAPSADTADDGTVVTARFMCPACMKPITHQRTFLFKPCGHVVCDKCTAQFVMKDKTCYTCSTPLQKGDVIPLQQGGTSFAGGGGTQAVAKHYRPSLIS